MIPLKAVVSGVTGASAGKRELFVKLDNPGARVQNDALLSCSENISPYLQTIASEEFEIVEVLESVTLQEDDLLMRLGLLFESIDPNGKLSSHSPLN
ncbi:hypothetical protein CEXT_465241 [Caerostris extrusa]|uniref:Uncharacterized protein n=1 Tax=Caerostris extrusa TaxID=172846 RepID=A0AAV4WV62_CAEEX|nr:hypothetical protein CEXT_465241 [Caerostris extrusa]